MIHRIRGLTLFADCLAVGLPCGDQRRRTGSGSALEALRGDALYKYTLTSLHCSQNATEKNSVRGETKVKRKPEASSLKWDHITCRHVHMAIQIWPRGRDLASRTLSLLYTPAMFRL